MEYENYIVTLEFTRLQQNACKNWINVGTSCFKDCFSGRPWEKICDQVFDLSRSMVDSMLKADFADECSGDELATCKLSWSKYVFEHITDAFEVISVEGNQAHVRLVWSGEQRDNGF